MKQQVRRSACRATGTSQLPSWVEQSQIASAGRAAHSSSDLTSHGCGYVSVHWIVPTSLGEFWLTEVAFICAPL